MIVTVTLGCRYALDTENDAADRRLVHRLLDFLVHFKMGHKVPITHACTPHTSHLTPNPHNPHPTPTPHAAAALQEAEHSSGSLVDKLCDSSLLLHGSVNDTALTKLLRLGYIRDVTLQEWRGAGSPHAV